MIPEIDYLRVSDDRVFSRYAADCLLVIQKKISSSADRSFIGLDWWLLRTSAFGREWPFLCFRESLRIDQLRIINSAGRKRVNRYRINRYQKRSTNRGLVSRRVETAPTGLATRSRTHAHTWKDRWTLSRFTPSNFRPSLCLRIAARDPPIFCFREITTSFLRSSQFWTGGDSSPLL